MVNAKTRAVLAALITLGLAGCWPTGKSEDQAKQKTCSGQDATNQFTVRAVGVKDAVTKCLVDILKVKANSNSEAEQCVDGDLQALGLSGYTLHTSGTPTMRCLVRTYSNGACDEFTDIALSSSDAETCLESKYPGSNVTDVTASVSANGIIVANLCQSWCDTNN